jgi:T-complex protein 1 subunit delta
MSIKLDLSDKKPLIKAARTSLSSKIISQYSDTLGIILNKIGPLVVDAVYSVIDPKNAINVDLNDIQVVKKIGSTLDKTELVDGIVFPQQATKSSGGPSKMENAKIALIQFCLSPPKTDVILKIKFIDGQ